jgi:broad specificity phosphatase PhoE
MSPTLVFFRPGMRICHEPECGCAAGIDGRCADPWPATSPYAMTDSRGREVLGHAAAACPSRVATIAQRPTGRRVALVAHAGVVKQVIGLVGARKPAEGSAFRADPVTFSEIE